MNALVSLDVGRQNASGFKGLGMQGLGPRVYMSQTDHGSISYVRFFPNGGKSQTLNPNPSSTKGLHAGHMNDLKVYAGVAWRNSHERSCNVNFGLLKGVVLELNQA